MRRALLERRRQREHFIDRVSHLRDHIDDRGFALRQRAGLVDDERRETPGVLERSGIANDHPALCAASRADDDGGRRRETQRARTRDHEHDNGLDERAGGVARKPPRCHECNHRNHDNDRHKNAGDVIGEALNRRLRALRLANEANDSGKQCRIADSGRPAAQETFVVDCPGVHRPAGMFRHRLAFSSQHAFVDRRLAIDHDGVD